MTYYHEPFSKLLPHCCISPRVPFKLPGSVIWKILDASRMGFQMSWTENVTASVQQFLEISSFIFSVLQTLSKRTSEPAPWSRDTKRLETTAGLYGPGWHRVPMKYSCFGKCKLAFVIEQKTELLSKRQWSPALCNSCCAECTGNNSIWSASRETTDAWGKLWGSWPDVILIPWLCR